MEINQCVGCDDAAVLARSSGEEPGSHAIEQASRRWRGGRTRRKIVISTQVAADENAQDEMAAHLKKVDKGALEQGADFYKALP